MDLSHRESPETDIVANPDECKECDTKNDQKRLLEFLLETIVDECSSVVKQLDLLKRSHEQMKQKYEDLNKDNKK
jgi:hypothetical protein